MDGLAEITRGRKSRVISIYRRKWRKSDGANGASVVSKKPFSFWI